MIPVSYRRNEKKCANKSTIAFKLRSLILFSKAQNKSFVCEKSTKDKTATKSPLYHELHEFSNDNHKSVANEQQQQKISMLHTAYT